MQSQQRALAPRWAELRLGTLSPDESEAEYLLVVGERALEV
jgi:hypothetical protein